MSASYPYYEVTKSFNDADGKHRIGEIIVAVTNDQEQQLTDLEREGYVRFVGWSKPDRQQQQEEA